MSTTLASKVTQPQAKMFIHMAASKVDKVPSIWSVRRMLRTIFSCVPRRSAATPVPGGGVLSGEDIHGLGAHVVGYWTMSCMILCGALVSAFICLWASVPDFTDSFWVWVFISATSLLLIAASGMCLAADHRAVTKVSTSVAVRLIVARRGIYESPAAWIVDPQMWDAVYGRIVEHLSATEQDVVVALAEEWQGTAGELLDAAPLLVGLPAESERFSFNK